MASSNLIANTNEYDLYSKNYKVSKDGKVKLVRGIGKNRLLNAYDGSDGLGFVLNVFWWFIKIVHT